MYISPQIDVKQKFNDWGKIQIKYFQGYCSLHMKNTITRHQVSLPLIKWGTDSGIGTNTQEGRKGIWVVRLPGNMRVYSVQSEETYITQSMYLYTTYLKCAPLHSV